MAADLLTTIRVEIDDRLNELRPLLAEYEQLLSAADALAAEGSSVFEPPVRKTIKRRTRRTTAARTTAAPTTAASASAPTTTTAKAGRPSSKRERTPHSATGQAIVAALEHGSHTVSELGVATALSASEIRAARSPLRKKKAIVKTDRDGKTAYALPA